MKLQYASPGIISLRPNATDYFATREWYHYRLSMIIAGDTNRFVSRIK
jgi:hypothetical protein